MIRLNLLKTVTKLDTNPSFVVCCEESDTYRKRYIYSGQGIDLTLANAILDFLYEKDTGKQREYIE